MPDIVKCNGDDGRSDYILQWLDASGPAVNHVAPADNEDNQGLAGRLYQLCLHAMEKFYRQHQHQPSSKLRSNLVRECLGRFYLWGEPFGVGRLDKAFRQSDELRDSVLERLEHIGKLLLRKSAISIPNSKTSHQPLAHLKELKSVIEQGGFIIRKDRDDLLQDDYANEEEHESGGEGSSDSGSYDTIEDISFATACLSELGPSLMQNLGRAETARDSCLDLINTPFAVSGPAMTYVSLIREKFKQADYKLVERLGEANWQRHKDIREMMEKAQLSPEERAKLAEETGIASSIFHPHSDFHDSGVGTSVPAQIQYAPSYTSLQSSKIEGEQASPRVPREPSEVGAGKPFQCFLCRCIVTGLRNRVDWKMHVFADLRPYICTFSDCKVGLARFTNRATWADHEFSEHRHDRIWNCPECSEKFASTPDWSQHLQEMHQRTFTGPQLHVARNAAYVIYPRPVETEECPLCCVVLGKRRREFVKHIARHMEEIALMALPCDTEEDSDVSTVHTDPSPVPPSDTGSTRYFTHNNSKDPNSMPLQHDSETSSSTLKSDRVASLPDSTKEESEKSALSTTKLDSENPELLARETGLEAREERSHDQHDERLTDNVSNQEELTSQEMAAAKCDSRNQTATHDHLDERPMGHGKLRTRPPPPPPPPPSTPGRWNCGHCRWGGNMSIFYDTACTACGRLKDYLAKEY